MKPVYEDKWWTTYSITKTHIVNKTRADHKCHRCDEVILRGSKARYRNVFTGEREYYHYTECPRFQMLEKEKANGNMS